MKKLIYLSTIFIFTAKIAIAHRIDVFCYVENNNVKCLSKFSTGDPVVSGRYKVYVKDKLIIQGKGDKKGNFVFHIPENLIKKPEDIKVVCEASMGHKNFWIVKKDEYSSNIEEDDNTFDETDTGDEVISSKYETSSCDYKKMEKMFKIILSKELVPIKRDIAELKEPKIDFRDILGGIGYIFGIMGIILYFKSRD
ncbi:hypothetical protein JCM13304A_18670 [Desulfothermus okinawensis JCM 13304]